MSAILRSFFPVTAAFVICAAASSGFAQTRLAESKPGTATAPVQLKQQPSKRAPAAKDAKDKPAAKQEPKDRKQEPVKSASLVPPRTQPALLGQYDNWGAYWAAPDGYKVCFVAARPSGTQSNRSRKPAYLFISSRPHDKVSGEISLIASSPFKSHSDVTAVIAKKNYAMVASADGAWIKNEGDEQKLLDAMRKGGELVLKGTTDRGLQTTDIFSMKGLAQALDRIARECK